MHAVDRRVLITLAHARGKSGDRGNSGEYAQSTLNPALPDLPVKGTVKFPAAAVKSAVT